ncbi:MAG TPA: n-acetylglutamate synthase [Thermoanaerobaculia bacterium]|nr:n-acetylglutamate synthase [Thermoanaerobaculia bacterium]
MARAEIDFDRRRFRTVRNSDAGESSSETVFRYRQKGSVVWATYRGGDVTYGTLLARVDGDGRLEMVTQHLNKNGDFRTGRCRARTEVLPDGRYRLHETWEWTGGAFGRGRSVTEEVPHRRRAAPAG